VQPSSRKNCEAILTADCRESGRSASLPVGERRLKSIGFLDRMVRVRVPSDVLVGRGRVSRHHLSPHMTVEDEGQYGGVAFNCWR